MIQDLLLLLLVYLCNEFLKVLQLKDAAQLAMKKMPSAEQEAISQVRDTFCNYMIGLELSFCFLGVTVLTLFVDLPSGNTHLSFFCSYSNIRLLWL